MVLLRLRSVMRSFYGIQALTGVTFDVPAHGISGLIGPNGAGKTTLFNCITGVVPADGGQIHFDGRDITRMRPDRIAQLRLVRTFQIPRTFPRLSVLDNLLIYGAAQPGEGVLQALGSTTKSRARESELIARAVAIARRLNLMHVIGNPASDLSGGQKKLLEIGRALMTEPKLILLDEPIAGVNPTLAKEIGTHLRDLSDEGIAILLIEHHMDTIARLCDRVIVLADGRHLASGSFAEVANNPTVQEAYMGRRWRSAG
jgi:ABC-type branched-subunit amino acid transport system ATPase component